MKRLLTTKNILLFFLLLFFFWGCDTTVPSSNHPPSITSTPVTIATVDLPYTYNVEASDSDGDTLTYSLIVHPGGMSIDPASGLISWTPVADQEMDTQVEIMVSDGQLETIQNFVITFSDTSTLVLTGIVSLPETMFIQQGDTQSITSVTANFDDGSSSTIPLADCTYSTDNPSIATVSDGVITAVDAGSATITVSYTTGGVTKTDTISVTVTLQGMVVLLNAISVFPESMVLCVGESRSITSITASYSSVPDASIPLNDADYSSSNSNKVTVSSQGVVTGVQLGSATITVSYPQGGGIFTRTDTIDVTVSPVRNITQDTGYNTIQAALNAAHNNDTIKVSSGSYYESVTFPSGKVILLESMKGAAFTFIEGVDGKHTVTCNGSQKGTDIRGFTITHQIGDSGSGVYNTNGWIKLTNCKIEFNVSAQSGGGIWNDGATLDVFGCTINGNSADNLGGGILNEGTLNVSGKSVISNNKADYGGGICNDHGTTTLIDETSIIHNDAFYNGGGYYHDGGTTTVTGKSIISENSSYHHPGYAFGGGINQNGGTLNVTGGTVVSKNTAQYGGGINSYNGTLNVSGITVSENNTLDMTGGGDYGGGIRIYQSKATITGSTISKNTADYGGGICIMEGDVTIAANTVSENSAYDGGGIYIKETSPPIPYIIGAVNSADTGNFNHFIDNKKNNSISSGQHIRSDAGDIHGSYPNNYYSPD